MLLKTEDKIEITTKEIDFLINNFNLNNSDQITRFIITLIYKFNFNLLNYAIDVISKHFFVNKKYDFLILLGPLILGSSDAVEYFSWEKINIIIEKLISKIKLYTPKKHKKIYNLLHFLNCIV
jgi:hypothetical protein